MCQNQYYGVKVVYKYVVAGSNPETLYEEQVLKIRANSFDDAYRIADEYIASYVDKYINSNGDTVEIALCKVVDCFECYEEENGIQEVYSSFLKMDQNTVDACTSPCGVDELRILRHE